MDLISVLIISGLSMVIQSLLHHRNVRTWLCSSLTDYATLSLEYIGLSRQDSMKGWKNELTNAC